ncbi:DUF3515 domain-containing protein [Streptomyces turgidiscabies]|uniref:DUF3515 domain-containing protein n=1 Tax=Streptomyces turgidiscabies TaxID=85558 RepID=UPI001E19E40B|nr:DUF3515 domain-containing protein [Streptomyces turgidiscabies]MBW8739596.1 DUF3515 domain-containing protein [Streptomyces turgidiscabies]
MNFFRPRPLALPVLALLIVVTGCSSADDSARVTVPQPDGKTTKLCRNLDSALPAKVDGLGRDDPEPRSALTAGWGSPAIILRCGVVRPPKMTDPKVASGNDPKAVGGEVNGVQWLMEQEDGGSSRFTTASRLAYVELTVPKGRDTSGALVDLAAAVKKAVPVGIAN